MTIEAIEAIEAPVMGKKRGKNQSNAKAPKPRKQTTNRKAQQNKLDEDVARIQKEWVYQNWGAYREGANPPSPPPKQRSKPRHTR